VSLLRECHTYITREASFITGERVAPAVGDRPTLEAMSLTDWFGRHRWVISAPPEVDDGHATFDAASDPLRYEWAAERAYDKRGRLGDEGVTPDDVDIE
jgi:hypothetical protein